MKKIFSILLAASFLISTLGITVVMDYCPMKKSYSFSLKQNSYCCCKKGDDKCCKSKKISLEKIKDDFVVTEFHLNAPSLNYSIIHRSSFNNKTILTSKDINFFKDLPPPEHPVSLSILYCSILV